MAEAPKIPRWERGGGGGRGLASRPGRGEGGSAAAGRAARRVCPAQGAGNAWLPGGAGGGGASAAASPGLSGGSGPARLLLAVLPPPPRGVPVPHLPPPPARPAGDEAVRRWHKGSSGAARCLARPSAPGPAPPPLPAPLAALPPSCLAGLRPPQPRCPSLGTGRRLPPRPPHPRPCPKPPVAPREDVGGSRDGQDDQGRQEAAAVGVAPSPAPGPCLVPCPARGGGQPRQGLGGSPSPPAALTAAALLLAALPSEPGCLRVRHLQRFGVERQRPGRGNRRCRQAASRGSGLGGSVLGGWGCGEQNRGYSGRRGAGVSASEQSLAAEATLLPRSVSRVRVRMLSWKQIWCVGCLCFEW